MKQARFAKPASDNQVARPGTFLIARGNGNVALVGAGCFATLGSGEPSIFPDTMIGAVPNEQKVVPGFLERAWATRSVRRQIERAARTTNGTYKINQQSLGAVQLRLPPIPEQRRIAAILDQADAIRRKRRAAIALTEELLRSTFLDMFGDPVSNPKGWEGTALGTQISYLTSGSRGWAKYYSDEGRTFIRIQNVVRDRLDLTDVAYVAPPSSAEARRTRVKAGDVLLSITADLGRTAVVPGGVDGHINQHLALMRPGKRLEPYYLSAFLASVGGQRQFERLNRAAVKAGLNFSDIRSLEVLVPPVELQRSFTERRNRIRDLEGELIAAADKADTLFHALVQRAFRGDL